MDAYQRNVGSGGIGRDLAPSLGETEKKFVDEKFLDDLFYEKISMSMPKISDDLFLIIDPISSDFFGILPLVTVRPFSLRKTSISLKKFLCDNFLYSVLGGRMHGPSPTSNFGGIVPSLP